MIKSSSLKSTKCKILVVDDNAVNNLITTTYLERLGYKFAVASNGAEAVEMFRKDRYSLILMDLQMPVMSGIDAAKMMRHYEITKAAKHTPVIALTANDGPIYRTMCKSTGMTDYITKPFTIEELGAKIAHALSLYHDQHTKHG